MILVLIILLLYCYYTSIILLYSGVHRPTFTYPTPRRTPFAPPPQREDHDAKLLGRLEKNKRSIEKTQAVEQAMREGGLVTPLQIERINRHRTLGAVLLEAWSGETHFVEVLASC